MRRKTLYHLDWLTVAIYSSLTLIGCFTIYAAEYDSSNPDLFNFSQSYGKQIIWIAISYALAIALLFTDTKLFRAFSFLIYGVSILSLIAALVFARKVAGSASWLEIGGVKIQPAEFAKLATNLALAAYLSILNINIPKSLKNRIIAVSIFIVPSALIILQGDTGSALVFFALLLVLYREGWPVHQFVLLVIIMVVSVLALLINKYILVGSIAVLTLIIIYLYRKSKPLFLFSIISFCLAATIVFGIDYSFNEVLRPHQRTRINVLLGKDDDPKGAAYNVNQSKIAIGSGGLTGKGFLKGTQTKYNFVPEQNTDFIFCTIGEEHGFMGSIGILGLFLLLLIRIIIIAERQKIKYSRVYAYGVASILFFHMMVNIGMTIGLAPIIGIPLPFISYGGSSLMAFTILLFILIKLDAERKSVL